jgi:hypothetical protein
MSGMREKLQGRMERREKVKEEERCPSPDAR